MTRRLQLVGFCVLPLALGWTGGAAAQDLGDRPVAPPVSSTAGDAPVAPLAEDQVRFSAGSLEYDINGEIVTATGEVRMVRDGERLRADRVVWNRKTGKVVATGNIAVTNPRGDVVYGDEIELTDSLRDGVVDNLLLVLDEGGRLAARRGSRAADGTVALDAAAYTPCAVVDAANCPKEPSWKITAVRIAYRPSRGRIYYSGARIHLLGLPSIPLPQFSHPVGGGSDSGLLSPDIQYSRVNGLQIGIPYYLAFGPNRGLTLTPRLFTNVLPMMQADYQALTATGAYRITGYATVGRRSDNLNTGFASTDTEQAFRGYLDGVARFQLSPAWSVSGSLRVASDRTFLRRYDISRDDRLRNTVSVERIDPNSYLSITGWAVQTLRVNDDQGQQPIALPEIDYRRRINDVAGGRVELQLNSLAIGRTEGQDTQRAFAGARWDMRRLTDWGQELTLTAYARADLYHSSDTLSTAITRYRGDEGVQTRAIGALAADLRWPLIGRFGSGTQRLTPRFQIVAAPRLANLSLPNEDARAVDLEDSNLFALNRFAGYDRFEDSTRATYGVEWAVDLPGLTINTVVGQSYRLSTRETILPDGTGLSDRFSDVVGRTELRVRDLVSVVHRYRVDKDNLAVRRNEIDATIGSRSTYLLLGYLRLNRDLSLAEDLQDREEARVGGRVQFSRFWSAFASAVIDLTDRREDPLSTADGFDPIRHRVGVAYEDDCLRLGVTWRREYVDTGDARRGNRFMLTLALTNLGR